MNKLMIWGYHYFWKHPFLGKIKRMFKFLSTWWVVHWHVRPCRHFRRHPRHHLEISTATGRLSKISMDDEETKKVWQLQAARSHNILHNPRSNMVGFDWFLVLLRQTLLEMNQDELLNVDGFLRLFFPKPRMVHFLKNLSLICSSSVPSASAWYDERSRSGKELQVFRLVNLKNRSLMNSQMHM